MWGFGDTTIPFRHYQGDIYVSGNNEAVIPRMLEVASDLRADVVKGKKDPEEFRSHPALIIDPPNRSNERLSGFFNPVLQLLGVQHRLQLEQ